MVAELIIAGSLFGRVAYSDGFRNVRWRRTGNSNGIVSHSKTMANAFNKVMTSHQQCEVRSSQAASLRPWTLSLVDEAFVEQVITDAHRSPVVARDLPEADPRIILSGM